MKFDFGNFGGFNQDGDSGEYRWTPPKKDGGKPKKARRALSKGKATVISLVITIVFALLYFYFQLPALNIHSGDLYVFIILIALVWCASQLILGGFRGGSMKEYVSTARKQAAIPFYIICLCALVAIVGSVIGWRVFRARDYASLLTIEDGNFTEDVAEISFDQIPMLDDASANVLATRRLGELSDLVSQFEVNPESYQINYHNRPVRVTYLNYGDFFKWWNNQSDGIPAYLIIDMVTQEVEVARIDQGIRYSPSEYFFRDLDRYLRFHYPTLMFSDVNFEVNEEGEPYWVATVITKKIGLFGGEDVTGMPEYKRAQFIGRVFQDPMMGTAPNMQIEENLALANRRGKRRGLRWGVTQTERENYRQLLTGLGLGLEKRMTAKVGLLSGGQRQALTLLMAALQTPKLLLLDEHTAALDPATAAKVLELSDKIIQEHHLTAMMITHNMTDAIRHGNRLIMMDRGRIVLDISGEEKKRLTKADLLARFAEKAGVQEETDEVLLS